MTEEALDAAAAALLESRRSGRPIPVPPSGPADQDEAFAIQDRVAAALGPAGAWKIGRGGSMAPIATGLVRPSPCRWPAGEFIRIGIEAEAAFRLGRDLAGAPDAEEIRAAIASVHAAIEIVDSRFDVWPVPEPLWALADNVSNGGFVHEPEGQPWTGQPLGRMNVTVTAGGRTIVSGEGQNPAGDPFDLLVGLAGRLAGRGALKAGMFITTGSLSGLAFVEPGDDVVVEIAGLGRVEVSLPA